MSFRSAIVAVVCLGLLWAVPKADAQVEIMGKVWIPRSSEAAANPPPNTGNLESYFGEKARPDPAEVMPLSNVRCYASATGPDNEALAFRTWELTPTGWYRLMGMPGTYTLLFTGPSIYIRPTAITNVFMRQGDRIDYKVVPPADYAVFDFGAWDEKAASNYFQTFVAKSISITNVGFRVVHDGIDGIGPGSQNILVSVHKKGTGTPDTWEQVGPTTVVPDVDAGGPKSYDWSAAWLSGEVPTVPGQIYAIQLRAEKPGNAFQMFMHKQAAKDVECYRIGTKGQTGFTGRQLWMYVAGDGDGLLIPYTKRVQKEFVSFAGFAKKWSQTYVAKGRGLTGVLLYAATSGSQPGIHRQRAIVRIHEGGPSGPVVGVQKIAVGNGIYTGDASWGTFGVVYAPGEVPLEPGKTYAIEMESIENYESLHGYVNIKSVVSDDKPGFNPYKRPEMDKYDRGTAYKNSADDVGFDLDMQVIEYQHDRPDWATAVESKNLLANGNMEAGRLGDSTEEQIKANGNEPPKTEKDPGKVEAWKPFAVDPKTTYRYTKEASGEPNRFVRAIGGGANSKTADGGFVQKVTGLRHNETYRLSGKVRCSWPIDVDRGCTIGYDPTGQDSDPAAATIVWSPMVGVHSVWSAYKGEPIRPAGDAISVWLRARTKAAQGYPFKADFDDFALQRVQTSTPTSK